MEDRLQWCPVSVTIGFSAVKAIKFVGKISADYHPPQVSGEVSKKCQKSWQAFKLEQNEPPLPGLWRQFFGPVQ